MIEKILLVILGMLIALVFLSQGVSLRPERELNALSASQQDILKEKLWIEKIVH